MKRRELIRTVLSSLVATATLSSLAGRASGASVSDVSLKTVPFGALPANVVPIIYPNDVFAMPKAFWQNFHGHVYFGRAGTDPFAEGNQITVFIKTAAGRVSRLQQPVPLNKNTLDRFVAEKAILFADKAYSMAIYDQGGKRVFYLPDTAANTTALGRRLSEPEGYQVIGEIASFDALRKTQPLFDGAKVKLKSWHDGYHVGGGTFVGHLSAAKDDGGMVASSGGSYHWRRVVNDLNRVTLFDFGAIADGSTDTAPAITKMYHWAQNANQQISIQFPAGKFFVSHFDIGNTPARFFRLAGAPVNFGYFPATTLISDGKSDVLFNVNARWVEISNIIFHGGIQKRPNRQGFFHNRCPAGQFFRATCLSFKGVGGTCISLVDTLDCKIDQWYASHCTGDVIKAVWSDTKKGVWDHSTAIELSNFNAQHCKQGKVLNLPRCTQSIIHNGWIEHSDFPGDITDGQWIIDALSLEDCPHPLNATNSRLNMRQINLQAGSKINNATAPGAWLNKFERGSVQVESYGVAVSNSLKYGWLGSPYHFANNTGNEQWIELGRLYSPQAGDHWEIEITGQAGFDLPAGGFVDVAGDNSAVGKAVIQVQRRAHKSVVSWSATGASPITAVAYAAPYDTDTIIYVKVAKKVASAMALLKTTARDRFTAGQCAQFTATLKTVDTPPAGVKKALARFSLHNGLAGVGASETGDVMLASRQLSAKQVDTTQPQGYISVIINGEQCAIPYFRLRN